MWPSINWPTGRYLSTESVSEQTDGTTNHERWHEITCLCKHQETCTRHKKKKVFYENTERQTTDGCWPQGKGNEREAPQFSPSVATLRDRPQQSPVGLLSWDKESSPGRVRQLDFGSQYNLEEGFIHRKGELWIPTELCQQWFDWRLMRAYVGNDLCQAINWLILKV